MAKILCTVHDDAKDKPMEVELGWIGEKTENKFEPVAKDRRDAAVAWAKAQIEAEEMGDDDDEDDE